MDTIINLGAFGVLTALWVAFAGALILNPSLLDRAWRSFRGSNIVVQIVVVLLTLPVVAGLWVWETRWPIYLRLGVVAGLAWITIYTFFPRLPIA